MSKHVAVNDIEAFIGIPADAVSRGPKGKTRARKHRPALTGSWSAEERKAAKDLNVALWKSAASIVKTDRSATWQRWAAMLIIAAGTVFAGVGLLRGLENDDKGIAAISAAPFIGAVALTVFVNPLATIERELFFRRWSDVILAGWAAEIAPNTATVDSSAATAAASSQFAALAATYASIHAKTVDGLATITTTAVAAADKPSEEEAEAEDDTEFAVADVPAQTTKAGAALAAAVKVAASGGTGKYKYEATGLPEGLTITAGGGEITGTVDDGANPGDTVVTVKVSDAGKLEDDAKRPDPIAVKFVWTITS